MKSQILTTVFLTFFQCIHLESMDVNMQAFDDSITYSINWPGSKTDNLKLGDEYITVVSSNKEKYHCYLPNTGKEEVNTKVKYDGPSALGLVAPLFVAKLPCSYRIDSYWTYEVCHGRHVKQFHESREGKTVRMQAFMLGQWDELKLEAVLEESRRPYFEEDESDIPTKKIDGNVLPYFSVQMGNGTQCDLNNNEPRHTTVIYVCYPHGKNEIYSVKETSICQYEIIILTPILCSHPKYKPDENGNNNINCLPVDGSPKKPYNLFKMNKNAQLLRRQAAVDQIRVEFVPIDLEQEEKKKMEMEDTSASIYTTPIQKFLSGQNCLVGGKGWWKYLFCYGKTVEQFHVEKDGSQTSIVLGKFDKQKHLEWIAKNPHKKPKEVAQRTQLSHYYSDGSVCDKTGKPRQTEVKLKCLENTNNLNTLSLYLLEPRYCEYIFGVESPLVCDILHRADENGLVDISLFDVAEDSATTSKPTNNNV